MQGAKPKEVVHVQAEYFNNSGREHTIYKWTIPWERVGNGSERHFLLDGREIRDTLTAMKARDAAPGARPFPRRRATFATAVCVTLALTMLPRLRGASPPGERVFTLREVSAFEAGESEFVRGQSGETQTNKYTEVKGYPQFTSSKPIYGLVKLGVDYRVRDSGTTYYFAIDESKGTGKGYDRFYFDANHDLDLRNDTVVKPLENPPSGARLNYSSVKEQVIFQYLSIGFGSATSKPIEIMPRLMRTVYDETTYDQVSFVRTHLYAGQVRLGSKEYNARLGNKYIITDRMNQPGVALALDSPGNPSSSMWWGSDSLGAIHKVDGVFYTCSASASGDKLTVRPYDGELGTLEIGPGKRSIDKLSLRGSLSGTNTAVAVGGETKDGWPQSARTCQVPVGDYLPNSLNLEYGRLQIFVSDNYHSDGKPRERGAPVYGVKVRKDKPFVLDFSNLPQVLFASPAKGITLKPGDTLEVKAVLIDPVLDIMIRELSDTTRKARPDQTRSRNALSLDPTVTVKRSNGDKVAEGIMPFG